MLWSSYHKSNPELLPNVLDTVTYRGKPEPWLVTRRTVDDTGTVFLYIEKDGEVRREIVELLVWYPQVGDMCRIAAKAYLDWRKRYQDYEWPEWTQGRVKLLRIDGSWADVQVAKGRTERLPFECLIVDKVDA